MNLPNEYSNEFFDAYFFSAGDESISEYVFESDSVILPLSGSIQVQTLSQSFSCEVGDALFLPPRTVHSFMGQSWPERIVVQISSGYKYKVLKVGAGEAKAPSSAAIYKFEVPEQLIVVGKMCFKNSIEQNSYHLFLQELERHL